MQGIASPQVEYMLCSLAVRLAEQKGLHRRPHQSWNLTSEEIAGRNRLFWVLYWLDKTISLRSGRHSVRHSHFRLCVPTHSILRSLQLKIETTLLTWENISASSTQTLAVNFPSMCLTSTPAVEKTTRTAAHIAPLIFSYASHAMRGSAQESDASCIPQQHSLTCHMHSTASCMSWTTTLEDGTNLYHRRCGSKCRYQWRNCRVVGGSFKLWCCTAVITI